MLHNNLMSELYLNQFLFDLLLGSNLSVFFSKFRQLLMYFGLSC